MAADKGQNEIARKKHNDPYRPPRRLAADEGQYELISANHSTVFLSRDKHSSSSSTNTADNWTPPSGAKCGVLADSIRIFLPKYKHSCNLYLTFLKKSNQSHV